MCVIAVSRKGARQPTEDELRAMFRANPHGAGYMTARGGHVEISKGFMTEADFIHAVNYEGFGVNDPVVYHCRISTQAGTGAAMTHPFPLTDHIADCKMLDCSCPVGVAHNGIIRMTSDPRDKEYSDTAHYIAEFMHYLIRTPDDLHDPAVMDAIRRMTDSKWAIMDGSGYIATVGDFCEDDGVLFSNRSYRSKQFTLSPVNTPRRIPVIYTKVRRTFEPEWTEEDFAQLDC